MVEAYRRRGPLAALALSGHPRGAGSTATVRLTECAPRGQIALRGDAGSRALRGAAEKALGVALPVAPNTVSTGERATVLWLGPDEWLAVVPAGDEAGVLSALQAPLQKAHALASDVSHSRGIIGLAGTGAPDLLARGCSLDLHPSVFGPGRCAQSSLARCHMLLHQVDAAPAFEIYVHRSFMEYAWTWLRDAARAWETAFASDAG